MVNTGCIVHTLARSEKGGGSPTSTILACWWREMGQSGSLGDHGERDSLTKVLVVALD